MTYLLAGMYPALQIYRRILAGVRVPRYIESKRIVNWKCDNSFSVFVCGGESRSPGSRFTICTTRFVLSSLVARRSSCVLGVYLLVLVLAYPMPMETASIHTYIPLMYCM
jgi:hypothetical protein